MKIDTDDEALATIRDALTWMDHFAKRHCDGTIENVANEALDALALLGAEDTPSVPMARVRIREVKWWGPRGAEYLYATDKDEAIEAIIDGLDAFPEKIEICGYAEMIPDWAHYAPLESMLDNLDEEYGDPDGGYTKPTPDMKKAEEAFMSVIAEEYEPCCEVITQETIDVAEWIKVHRPDWLEVSL